MLRGLDLNCQILQKKNISQMMDFICMTYEWINGITTELPGFGFPASSVRNLLRWFPAPVGAGLPTRETGTNLLPELRYINKFSDHWQNRLVQVLTGNPLSPVFRSELFIPVSRTCSTRSKKIYFCHSCASKEYTLLFEITPSSGH